MDIPVQPGTLDHKVSPALLVDTLDHKAQSDIPVQLALTVPLVDIQGVLARLDTQEVLV
jgi:hypothetical protein